MNISENFLIDLNDESKWKNGLNELYSDFSKVVELTEEAYDHFLNCLPPLVFSFGGYVSGEPYSHNNDGKGIYLCATKKDNKYYAQMGTVSDFLKRKLFK